MGTEGLVRLPVELEAECKAFLAEVAADNTYSYAMLESLLVASEAVGDQVGSADLCCAALWLICVAEGILSVWFAVRSILVWRSGVDWREHSRSVWNCPALHDRQRLVQQGLQEYPANDVG